MTTSEMLTLSLTNWGAALAYAQGKDCPVCLGQLVEYRKVVDCLFSCKKGQNPRIAALSGVSDVDAGFYLNHMIANGLAVSHSNMEWGYRGYPIITLADPAAKNPFDNQNKKGDGK